LAFTVFFICPVFASGQDSKPIQLLSPQKDAGRPLMQVLNDRKSSREFSDAKLPDQVLSNLLWAAAGVNRGDSGKRTAPSAVNWQEIDVYVATADGLFLYDPKMHALNPILSEDIRGLTGRQAFVKNVPVNLLYVADFSRMGKAGMEDKILYSAADTGFISQNVYLYCASEGLATVVRGLLDRSVLGEKIKLGPDQRVILVQSVGYPEK
jgi:SagB-type dehydrogenase family enzyme